MKQRALTPAMRAALSRSSCLYLVAGPERLGDVALVERLQDLLEGGVSMVQLRAKDSARARLVKLGQEMQRACAAAAVPFVVNDDPELARELGADGVHLGQEDMCPGDARAIVGEHVAIGLSTHDTEQVRLALLDDNVDMIGFGPIFHTTTKDAGTPRGSENLREALAAAGQLPVFAIGGVSERNVRDLVAVGCRRFAVASALLYAADPRRAAADLSQVIRADIR